MFAYTDGLTRTFLNKEGCIITGNSKSYAEQASGGDADDEDFFITIKFDIFAKPDIDPTIGLAEVSVYFPAHFTLLIAGKNKSSGVGN